MMTQLTEAKKRLDDLENGGRPGSSVGSGGISASPSSAPVIGAGAEEIDRARVYCGTYDWMSKASVEKQLQVIIKDFNDQGKGCLVVDEVFIPATVVNFWVKFKPSLGKSAVEMGKLFRSFVFLQKYIPVGSEGVKNKFGEQVTIWSHLNRTNDERNHTRKVNSLLAWLHGLRRDLNLAENYDKGAGAMATTVRGAFFTGKEAAYLMGKKVGQMSADKSNMELVSDADLEVVLRPLFEQASKPFDLASIKASWEAWLQNRATRA